MPEVILAGCQTQPLGSYLKALGVFRLVSLQADRQARGWFESHRFHLESRLDQESLIRFFLEEYRPTPIIDPWNGSSGFYPKDRKVGIRGLENSSYPRFDEYRQTISTARSLLGERTCKPETEQERRTIQCACRNWLPDSCVDWLDAVVAITAEGSRAFPPILGTGGNEGHLDYTNNFMERLVRLLVEPNPEVPVEELLRNSLFDTVMFGLVPAKFGQFDPGRAGGPNQAQGVGSPDIPSNPWNFVLGIEGTIAWASGLHRRQGNAYSRVFLCSPFTVMPKAVGYNSASEADEKLARAEIWVPVWSRKATFQEIEALLREGRAQVNGEPAKNGLDFARAATALGVDRAIEGFVRFGLMKRRGDSYVALPFGYFRVREREHRDLLQQIAPAMERVENKGDKLPRGVASAIRQFNEAVYQFLLRDEPERFIEIASALGRVQKELLLRSNGEAGFLSPNLSDGWLTACEGAPEGRIAAALAMMRAYEPEDRKKVVPIRENLTRGNSAFSWEGVNLTERMSRVLARRVLDAERNGSNGGALWSPWRVHPGDVHLFLEQGTDDQRIEDLLFAFTLVKWSAGDHKPQGAGPGSYYIPNDYVLLRRVFDPETETSLGEPLRGEPRILPLLSAGRVKEACAIAERRLMVSGLNPVRAGYSNLSDGARMAAALLIPVYGMKRPYERISLAAATTA